MTEENEKTTKPLDKHLDRLYTRGVRCSYCRTIIAKYTMTCEKCGVTKKQILESSNMGAKEIVYGKKEGRIIKTRRRPDDIHFGRLIIFLVFLGPFGAHNFYVGRKLRGWIMLISTSLMVASMMIFPIGRFSRSQDAFVGEHPWRTPFADANWWFPLDLPGFIAILVWIVDWFSIVLFNTFKYPVRIPTPQVTLEYVEEMYANKEKEGKGKIKKPSPAD